MVDATAQPVGRLSTAVAHLLLGKHKPSWAPHVDSGDFVIVVNAEKAVADRSARKSEKIYYRHTRRAGVAEVAEAPARCASKHPTRLVESAV